MAESNPVEKLSEEGAKLRSRAVRAQMTSVVMLCNYAESELEQDEVAEARTVVSKIRKEMAMIHHHLEEAGDVRLDAVDELGETFADLTRRVEQIEALFLPSH
jgi:hypothetical protein